ncbi:MAG: hypothetical protein KAW09_01045 [Thermoplasmata archaeon]|nr:hypothetical protein [Thermoplasmata archaeon]
MMDKQEYVRLQREYQSQRKQLKEGHGLTDDLFELGLTLLENNSFDNPLTRDIADEIIDDHTDTSIDFAGGYRLYEAVNFQVEGRNYVVIAYGASREGAGGGTPGRDALQGIVFAVEGELEE